MRTREKIKEKHPEKKVSGGELFPTPQSLKPLSGTTATAAQIHSLIAHPDAPTDATLRRLSSPAAGAPCFPAPTRGEYQLIPTLAGLVAHYLEAARLDHPDHPIYLSMDDAETRGLIPREAQKFAQSQGLDFINRNRQVRSEPLRKFLFDIQKKIFAKGGPDLKSIHGMETWDKDTEMAKKLREERIKLEDERAIRDQIYVEKETVDEQIYGEWLGKARATIEAARKTMEREHRHLVRQLFGSLPADDPHKTAEQQLNARYQTVTDQRFDAMLAKLRTDKKAAPAAKK